MPFLRLYADALGVRLLNPTTRWEPNDLVNMLYLACAAAYADGVAADARLRGTSTPHGGIGRTPAPWYRPSANS